MEPLLGKDRRFLQSAGPFTLLPGAVNEITIGVVWCRSGSGGATGSLSCLKVADDAAQALFDRDFQLLTGPNAPDVDIVELDEERKAAMVSNLMVILCSDKEVAPVLNTGTLNH